MIGTVSKGDEVATEASGAMTFPDRRTYRNTYHPVARFKGHHIVSMHEHFDRLSVQDVFGPEL